MASQAVGRQQTGKGGGHVGFARQLFDGIAPGYDTWAQLLSYGQYRRWHRALVASVAVAPEAEVLDIATGTGSVARALARRYGCTVLGIDLSPRMAAAARTAGVPVAVADASRLPFADERFDAVTFTFLLRYVPDPAATLAEIARVVRPGGVVAALEFHVPPQPLWRRLWELHTAVVLPAAGAVLGPGWRQVGGFLGGSIEDFYRRYSLADLAGLWEAAGLGGVEHRLHSLGGAVITRGVRQ